MHTTKTLGLWLVFGYTRVCVSSLFYKRHDIVSTVLYSSTVPIDLPVGTFWHLSSLIAWHVPTRNILTFVNTTAIAYGQKKISRSRRFLLACNRSCVHKRQDITGIGGTRSTILVTKEMPPPPRVFHTKFRFSICYQKQP